MAEEPLCCCQSEHGIAFSHLSSSQLSPVVACTLNTQTVWWVDKRFFSACRLDSFHQMELPWSQQKEQNRQKQIQMAGVP